MCVHGIAISTIVQIKRMAWGTVARWLESAATYAVRFNDRMLKGFLIRELQADEIRTFVGNQKVGDLDNDNPLSMVQTLDLGRDGSP